MNSSIWSSVPWMTSVGTFSPRRRPYVSCATTAACWSMSVGIVAGYCAASAAKVSKLPAAAAKPGETMRSKPVRSTRSRSPDSTAAVIACTTSPLVGLDCVPPADVLASVSVAIRSGARSASSWATMPPIEKPKTCVRSMLERVEQRERVGGEVGGRDVAGQRAAAAGAAVVVEDELEAAPRAPTGSPRPSACCCRPGPG